MAWVLNADETKWIFTGDIEIPVDPSTGVAMLMLNPKGGSAGEGIPPIAKGDPGVPAELDTTVNFTELAYDDPTPASASFTVITPPTDETPGLYRLNLAVHEGEKGDDGTTSIDMDSVGGTAAAGKLLKVNGAVDGFDYGFEKVGGVYIPATVNNTTAGTANSTLAVVSIPARNNDYKVRCFGSTIVTQSGGSNVVVDLVARLNGETGGNVVGRCSGLGGTERLTMTPGPPAGSADTFDKVLAGNSATIHFRAEQRSGSNTYTTSASTSLFSVEVIDL